ncbi:hypothetical protein Sango_2840500 [Sesamum angolense]|uniref:Uncharacterized protein n=1 Tax=Sesamum angolense TaxID=2727404 RepID=A0AAE1T6H7_9LAMI|nr:hypothetical protein Sango_2840500 [Sesamum angolense]
MEDKKDMQGIIKEHINLGLIEPGVSAYNSPGSLVRNHGEIKSGKLRLVINYQGINKILEFDGYYIPSREHLIDCIKGAKVFSNSIANMNFIILNGESDKDFQIDIVVGQIQRADLDIVQILIRTSLLASTSLWNDLKQPIRKISPSGMTNELREHDPKHALRVQGSRPVASDSSTDCTRPSPDSGETMTIQSQEVQTFDNSSQLDTFGVKEGEISLQPMTDTSKANTNELTSSSSAWQVHQ